MPPRSVYQVMRGKDGGWPTNNRGDGRLSLKESLVASGWISLCGIAGLLAVQYLAPNLLLWLLPVCLPLAFAPLILWWSSRPGSESLLTVPGEISTPPVVALHDALLNTWQTAQIGPDQAPQSTSDRSGKTVRFFPEIVARYIR